jgi:hypothetical protein
MCALCIDPLKSVYEIINGPYNWNQYPLAPLGCKAVIYEDGDTRGSWASWGVDGWYLGPSKDHYDLFYVIETHAYHVSGLTDLLFPKHCRLPNLTPHQHLQALTDELLKPHHWPIRLPKRQLIKYLGQKIKHLFNPIPILKEQRVAEASQLQVQGEEQRVINDTPIITIPYIMDLPTIMQTRNPTAKCALTA